MGTGKQRWSLRICLPRAAHGAVFLASSCVFPACGSGEEFFKRKILFYWTAEIRRKVKGILAGSPQQCGSGGQIFVGVSLCVDCLCGVFFAVRPRGAFSPELRRRDGCRAEAEASARQTAVVLPEGGRRGQASCGAKTHFPGSGGVRPVFAGENAGLGGEAQQAPPAAGTVAGHREAVGICRGCSRTPGSFSKGREAGGAPAADAGSWCPA